MNPRYPVFIPSKGRARTCQTPHVLARMGVPHVVVVEPTEVDEYRECFPERGRVLTLPFSDLGQGSIPARNWIWERAEEMGAARHWIVDDNIRCFYRLNFNRRIPVDSGTIFRCAEDFTDRYENVALSGMNNIAFVADRDPSTTPVTWNTRIYSITLIDTSLPFRWRGRFNEDTDLCLRVLKAGFCTAQFNVFLADKATTMTMGGGNTDTVYGDGDHRRAFAESLNEQHPDVARVVWKFGRWHHQVDYSAFRANEPIYHGGVVATGAPDEYGMVLRRS